MTISDTGPLYYLNRVGLLRLLPELFGAIVVPQAVLRELARGREQGDPVPDLEGLEWVESCGVSVPDVLRLIDDLGPGESEVIALALENPGALVILDDGFARRIAANIGVQVVGSAGILLKAKQVGLLELVGPILDRMIDLGFRLHPEVRATVLERAGEE